ncbi:MAG: hypothetical protein GF333_00950 [Candidatus Omnitrophica bacterium]|nr:hypothetical protein [Candidatus Omnitrophota bacterium]
MVKKYMLLYGRNSVYERLKTNPHTVRKVFVRDSFDVPHIEKALRRNRIPVETVSAKKLESMKPARDLQGIVARVQRFEYAALEDFTLCDERRQRYTLIFLDRLHDPQNLGVIIRTAACFGKFAVVIPAHKACEVTEAVLHVASGGENYVPVCKVANLSNALLEAKKHGYWLLGGVLSGEAKKLPELSIPCPAGIVLGSEGAGVRYGVRKHLDIETCIPMQGAALSLNVAMACAIFCYEVAKQREMNG